MNVSPNLKLRLEDYVGPVLVCFAGLALIMLVVDLAYDSTTTQRVMSAMQPVGRKSTIIAIVIVIVMMLTMGTDTPNMPPARYVSGSITLVLLFACIGLSLLPALSSWATVDPVARPIGGLVPVSDSSLYLSGAEQLIGSGELAPWNQRRPLNTVLLSARLVLGKHSFQTSLLLQGALFGVALFFAVYVVLKQYGVLAACLMFALNYAFAARYLPTTLSESLGISLGLLSVAFFLSSIQQSNRKLYHYGLFVLSLALLARSGPMLVLPLVVLFAGWVFRNDKAYDFRQTILASIVVIVAVLFNYSLNLVYGASAPGETENFHYVLYKIAVDGDSWRQVRIDYPEAYRTLSPNEFVDFTYARAFKNIAQDPLSVLTTYARLLLADSVGFMSGLLKAYMYSDYVYTFKLTNLLDALLPLPIHRVVQVKKVLVLAVAGLAVLGVIYGTFRLISRAPSHPLTQLLGLTVLGTFLSLPFLYNIAGVRVFASVMPFLSLLIVVAVNEVRRNSNFARDMGTTATASNPEQAYMKAALFFILCLAMAMPAVSYHIYGRDIETADYRNFTCESGKGDAERRRFILRIGKGTAHIDIVDDESRERSFVPYVRKSDFVLNDYHTDRRMWLRHLQPGDSLFMSYDFLAKRRVYLVARSDFLDGGTRYRLVCGELTNKNGKNLWRVLRSETM